ncbi:MAG: LUD domain-containing protein [Oscillibacter sp.]|jgi:L-lactate utilization protein LutB|nr:LUD domain-containing protein [Oscillibacter sp.]
MKLETVKKNLEDRGYTVRLFPTGAEAADYLEDTVAGKTVGFGGSVTLDALGLYERLGKRCKTIWHWKWEDASAARREAQTADIYLTSVNALAETGELVNIDGAGNRVASTLFGHEKVYFVIGRNKLAPTVDAAVWRARNIASPRNAQRLGRKTPCAVKGDRCYDCRSPERICRGLVTLWGPMLGMEAEVLLIDEDLGM